LSTIYYECDISYLVFSPIRSAPLQSLITRPVLHAIFAGQLPGGTRLIEEDLAAQFQISRAPVREALREIAAMGLVELRQNRGAIVMPFNPESLRGIYHVRMALESEAARLAVGHFPPAEADRFEKVFAELLDTASRDHAWSVRMITFDEEFHEMIATWAGVARLSMEIKRYYTLVHEIREAQGRRFPAQEAAVRQHMDIIRAIRKGDAEEAAQAMRTHILGAGEWAVNALFPDAPR
jgi:DNA-binding GntR family transcriptional regulator